MLRPYMAMLAYAAGLGDAGPCELSVLLCDDAFIRGLNQQWRKKNEETDVLSFPSGDDDMPGYPNRVLGDIIINLDAAVRQAASAG